MKQLKKEPTAKVAINKSLLKKYRVEGKDTYFLENGTEFEIELRNPTQETVMADIELNGKKMQHGLVLKPGEGIFLKRHMDTNKRLVFETYEVEDNEDTEYAIAKNGNVRVTFYKEIVRIQPVLRSYDNYWVTATPAYDNVYGSGPSLTGDVFYCNSTITLDGCGTVTTSTAKSLDSVTYTPSTADFNDAFGVEFSMEPEKKETGRIELGEATDQEFDYVNKDFSNIACTLVEFKLMPASQRPKTAEDLKVRTYCIQCGKKAKPKDKFCSACGTKLE